MFLPINGWHTDRAAHLLFLENRPAPDNTVLVIFADSLDAFARGLTENGLEHTAHADGPGGRAALTLFTPGSGELIAVEIGDEKIAFATSADSIAIALGHIESGAWKLDHDSLADFTVTLPMPGFESPDNPMRQVARELARNRHGMLAEFERAQIDPKLGEALIDIFAKRLPALGEEMVSVRAVAVDTHLYGDALGLGIRFLSKPESFLAQLGESMEKRANMDGALLPLTDTPAWLAIASAAPADIIPDLPKRLTALAADFDSAFVWQNGVDKASPGLEALVALSNNEWALAANPLGDQMQGTLYAGQPASQFISSFDTLVRSANAFSETAITEANLKFDIVSKSAEETDAADPGRQYRLTFRQPAHIDSLLQVLRIGNPALTMTRETMENRTLTVTGNDSHTVLTLDSINPATGAGANSVNASSLARMLQFIPHRQGGFALADADKLMETIFMSMLRYIIEGMDAAHASLHIEAVAKVMPTMLKTRDVVGMSLGAKNNQTVIEAAIPYGTLGAALYNYEAFVRATTNHAH